MVPNWSFYLPPFSGLTYDLIETVVYSIDQSKLLTVLGTSTGSIDLTLMILTASTGALIKAVSSSAYAVTFGINTPLILLDPQDNVYMASKMQAAWRAIKVSAAGAGSTSWALISSITPQNNCKGCTNSDNSGANAMSFDDPVTPTGVIIAGNFNPLGGGDYGPYLTHLALDGT